MYYLQQICIVNHILISILLLRKLKLRGVVTKLTSPLCKEEKPRQIWALWLWARSLRLCTPLPPSGSSSLGLSHWPWTQAGAPAFPLSEKSFHSHYLCFPVQSVVRSMVPPFSPGTTLAVLWQVVAVGEFCCMGNEVPQILTSQQHSWWLPRLVAGLICIGYNSPVTLCRSISDRFNSSSRLPWLY